MLVFLYKLITKLNTLTSKILLHWVFRKLYDYWDYKPVFFFNFIFSAYFSQSQLPAKTATVKTAPPSRKKNEEKMSQNFLPDSSKFHVSESSDDDVVMTSQKSQVTSSQRSLRVGRKQNFKFSSSSEEVWIICFFKTKVFE